jgi:hypothetical protein
MPRGRNTYVISGLLDKRAHVAGEIFHVEGALKQRREQLIALDVVIRMFVPDCDPETIPPIKPVSPNLFFKYGELPRLVIGVLRKAEGPMLLDQVVNAVTEAKGLTVDRKIRRHIRDTVRVALGRLEHRRKSVRRVIRAPDTWWELVW